MRIWLAAVAAVVVLSFAVGVAWRLTREPAQLPVREWQIKNAAGDVIGTAQTRSGRKPAEGLEFDAVTKDGQNRNIFLPRPLPPAGKPWGQLPFGFGWALALVAVVVVVVVAVALGSYPIIRRLTQRLDRAAGLTLAAAAADSQFAGKRAPLQRRRCHAGLERAGYKQPAARNHYRERPWARRAP